MRTFVLMLAVLLAVTMVLPCKDTGKGEGKDGDKAAAPAAKEPGLPILFSFETDAAVKAWKTEKEEGIADAVVLSVTTDGVTDGKRALKMLLKEHQWPGAYTETLATRDWSTYAELQLDVTVKAPISLAVRIDDVKSTDYESRFQLSVDLDEGKNTVKVILDDVAEMIDLKKVKRLTLFSSDITEDTVFVIDNIRLAK